MSQRDRYYLKAPFYTYFKKCFFIFFLILAVLVSGCGNSNYNSLSDGNSEETSTKTEGNTVREHWTTITDLHVNKQSVEYAQYAEDDENNVPEIITGETDSISIDMSLVADKDDHITCDGVINLSDDVSNTRHPMALTFEKSDVTITGDTLTITGTDFLATKDTTGTLIQPLSDLTLTITKNGSQFTCDVTIGVESLDTRIHFEIEIFRSSDSGGPLSFITSTWAKQSPGVVVHFPRKLYSNQSVLTGTSENALLSFQLTHTPKTALVSGQLNIPSNLSCNGDDIQIDIRNAFAFINEDQHTFKFYQAGTVNTLDTNKNSVDTAYSLLVTVTANNIFVYSPGSDENIIGRRTQYTTKISFLLDRPDTDAVDERTTLVTEIKRTDVENTISDQVQYPPLSGGAFILEGQKTYSLFHAESSKETEDTVNTTADNVILDLLISYVDGEGLKTEGNLSLTNKACPDNQPSLFVNLNGIIPVFLEDGSINMVSSVILEKKHSNAYSTFVSAELSLLITKQENGEFLCDATLTSDDLETGFKFSTKAIYHSDATSFWPINCSLAQDSNHTLSWITDGSPTTYTTMAGSNTKVNTAFGWRVDQGIPSVKANGSVGLELNTETGPRLFEFFFHDADVTISEDGKNIVISGKWFSRADNSLYDLTINLYETESGAAAYKVSLFLPSSMFVEGIGYTVEFFVMADHISGPNELLNILIGIEVNPLDAIVTKKLISGLL